MFHLKTPLLKHVHLRTVYGCHAHLCSSTMGTMEKCLVSKSKMHICFKKAQLREKQFKFKNNNDKEDKDDQQRQQK